MTVSGIRISKSATAVVHAEGPGGGDSATLCGKGADYIHGVDEDPTCKGCVKALAKQEAAERARQEDTLSAASRAMGHSTPRSYAEFLRAGSDVDGASRILREMRVAAEVAQDGLLADWLTDALIALRDLGTEDLSPSDTAEATLVTGHEAESHSRRGRECRFCSQPVVDHEAVKITDGVAVSWWTGAQLSEGVVLNPERVALVEARREAARAQDALLSDIEEWQTNRRDGRYDGLFIPDAYAHEVTMALWNAGRIVPGSKVAPASGKLGWFSVRMIDADHAEALTMAARTEVKGYTPGDRVFVDGEGIGTVVEVDDVSIDVRIDHDGVVVMAGRAQVKLVKDAATVAAESLFTGDTSDVDAAVGQLTAMLPAPSGKEEAAEIAAMAARTEVTDPEVTCSICPNVADSEALMPDGEIVPLCASVMCREVTDDNGAIMYDVISGTEIRERGRAWSCMVCGARFTDLASIDAHLAVEGGCGTEEAPVACDCDPGEHGSTSHSPDCPVLVASIEAYRARKTGTEVKAIAPPTTVADVIAMGGEIALGLRPSEPYRDAWHKLIDSLTTDAERERSCAAMDAADRALGVGTDFYGSDRRTETWYAVAMEVYRASEPRWTTGSKRKASKRKVR